MFLSQREKVRKQGGGGGDGNGPFNKGLCALRLQVLETFASS